MRYLQFSTILIVFLISLDDKQLANKKKLAKVELSYYLNINIFENC